MNILITGGAGFIGVNLTAKLNAIGVSPRIIDNEVLGKEANLAGLSYTYIKADIRDANACIDAVKGMDCVVHLAADTRVIPSIENPRFNFDNNTLGTFNLLEAMRQTKVGRIVAASTGGAILGERTPPVHEEMLPKPVSPYGASKLAMEGYLSAFAGSYGIAATALRFSNVYGERSIHKGSVVAAFFRRIIAGKSITIYGDGEQIRDYVYIKDLCDGIIKAVNSGKAGVFQLGTGIPTTLNQLVALMREVTGREIEVLYEPFRDGEIRHTYCDIAKARRELGFDPATPLKDGLTATWNWFLAQ
ncbi:NAD-dependent epimerase/dehydratase [Desulfarculus baarsii DSM 2075]|uniref:NAD-dependent epimerase/dehydratase n=1 Tax=Desulfarculus baarsii (strain ATCC 33931 / DSM 2075 / LMG 7858 / VKM B-1802 / 2st14) TaxID=644282 RepID=E1QIW2_DESB2|nr:NAD-dependent epimerase/dehydratase family protein [Desulfarculus baarsii]ADK85505.1 NAD-dependent epimerase/dehydratase [Desulfarculus baarsii DSM 2075]